MALRPITLKDKKLFDGFLRRQEHELCVYAFENIYAWKALFDIRWAIIKDALCIFFRDKIACFLYCAPVGNSRDPEVVAKTFGIMDSINKNDNFSRLENVEERDLDFYGKLGYACRRKSCEYVCLRSELAALKGNRFKSKRAAFNYFVKHYRFSYLPYALRYKRACLKLYDSWSAGRALKVKDKLYQAMLGDSRLSLVTLLDGYRRIELLGRIVKVNSRVKGFTFGFRLNQSTFCVLYEITDLSVKGLAQFIFRQFCSELKGYRYINIMDDAGLENLKQVKLSYHPARLIPAYIVQRENA